MRGFLLKVVLVSAFFLLQHLYIIYQLQNNMTITFTAPQQQEHPISKVMSIGAITSPYSSNDIQEEVSTNYELKPTDYLLPPLTQQITTFPTAAVGHWAKSLNRESSAINMMHKNQFSDKRLLLSSDSSSSTNISSPSFSSSSSDHESDCNYSTSPIFCTLSNPSSSANYYHSTNKNRELYAREAMAKENLLNDFDLEGYNRSRSASFDYNKQHSGNSRGGRKTGNNRDAALATRRARNKLASAKYRAKKQALTHAMQERIMQLATQVMSLRDELSRTRRNEAEILARYERLLQATKPNYSQQHNNAVPSIF